MEPREALVQINGTIFKPGWTLSAYETPEGLVSVTFHMSTVDTSYVDAAGNFFRPKTLPISKILDVHTLDQAGLAYQLISLALEGELHEMREFMQVRGQDGRFFAPLHPHTYDGEAAWQRLGRSAGMLPDDNLSPQSLELIRLMEDLTR